MELTPQTVPIEGPFGEHIKAILESAARVRASRTNHITDNIADNHEIYLATVKANTAAHREWARLVTPEVVEALLRCVFTGENLPLQVPALRYDIEAPVKPKPEGTVLPFVR